MADPEFQKRLASWARQTIAFGICLRAQGDGQPVDDPAKVQHAGKAAERIVSELWEDTAKECAQAARFTMVFTAKVLDWVQDHRHSAG